MNRLSKIIKKATGITLAVTMVTSSMGVMAAPAVDIQPEVVGNAQVGSAIDNRLTWETIEDIVNVSEPSGISVTYLDNGITRTRNDCKEYADNMSDGWYVLNGVKTTSNAVTIHGKVNLILADDSYLHANNGIYITQGSELIIWTQSNSLGGRTGRIDAHPENGPGIGAVRDTMGGSLTINGGIIDAKGGKYAAGIGGGRGEKSGFGNITINGGFVYATGGDYAAGIGFGQRNWKVGVVTINGGEVTAKGGEYSAGIGGSEDRSGTTVTINGGKVDVKSGSYAAGIGGGDEGDQGGKITINGGIVNASSNRGAAIGGGGQHHTGIGHWERPNNGGEIEINGGEVNATGDEYSSTAIGAGQYGKNGPITINGGTVNAIIKNTSTGGAAIGSARDYGDAITINDGVVKASGLGYGPGIGYTSSISINGGQITSIAQDGAGIGGCGTGRQANTKEGSNCGKITITNGDVIAISCGKGAGIGNGQRAKGGSVTITGGNVTASSGEYEGGLWARINFSTPNNPGLGMAGTAAVRGLIWLFSMGDVGGAGIGGGYKGGGVDVKITGGNVVAYAEHSGSRGIGRGEGGSSDGKLEIYDEAVVSVGNDITKVAPVKKDIAEASCRNNRGVVIRKCDHTNAEYKDKNVHVHEINCPYCKVTGKVAEQRHTFDPQTHKCVCGRTQYKANYNIINNARIVDPENQTTRTISDGTAMYPGEYITVGDTMTITLANTNCIQDLEVSYQNGNQKEVVKPIEYKTEKDGTIVAKYTMPAHDIDVNYTVDAKPLNYGSAQLEYAPRAAKGLVYNGKSQDLLISGTAKNGKIYYAFGKDDKTAPAFDGAYGEVTNSDNNGSRTWNTHWPQATNAGTYYVWYMVKGDEGYTDIAPKCITCEIKSVESANKDTKTVKGTVRDITEDLFRNIGKAKTKKQVKTSVEVYTNNYSDDAKFDIEVGGKKLSQQKSGDTFEVTQGDKIKIDIPASVDADKNVQLFYSKRDGVTSTVTPTIKKVNEDGSLHVEYEMPGYDNRLVIRLNKNVPQDTKQTANETSNQTEEKVAAQLKKISYEAPKANKGLISNGKAQALIKVGSAKGGKMYYALGKSSETAPEFDGLSDKSDKTWGIGAPKASEPGKYYVWYMVKGDEGYEDVEPSFVEVEIGKSVQQKKEAVEEDEDDYDDIGDEDELAYTKTDNVAPTETPTPKAVTPKAKQPVVKTTDNSKLTDAVEVQPEEKEEGVNIWLEATDITDSIDENSKTVLYNRFSDYEIPIIYDLSMYMKVGDKEPVDIVDLSEKMELSLDIPNRYVKEERDYVIVRLNSDDPKDITIINPTAFDSDKNELIFSTDKICPMAIIYKVDESALEKTTTIKTPLLISPKAKEGLYYSGQDMELVTEGVASGGTIYYAIGDSEGNEPEFDGLTDKTDKKWTTSIPKGKDVGSYNVWYKVVGDKGYTDLDAAYVASVIKEVPTTTTPTVVPRKGQTIDVTDHPDMEDKNPQKGKIEGDKEIKPKEPSKSPEPSKSLEPSQASEEDDDEVYDEDEGIIYWIETHDITDTLAEEDIDIIYNFYRNYYIGKLFDLTLTMQVGEELYDVTELEEKISVSFEVPEDMVNPGRKYIIYMYENDNDYFESTVIRPTSYDEVSRRLTFETDKIKPFILAYTDDPEEKDVIVLEYEGELLSPLVSRSTVVSDNTKDDNVAITPSIPRVPTQTVSMSDNKASTVSYQNTDGTTIKLTSAKTGDENIIDIIIKMIIGLFNQFYN